MSVMVEQREIVASLDKVGIVRAWLTCSTKGNPRNPTQNATKACRQRSACVIIQQGTTYLLRPWVVKDGRHVG